MRDGEAGRTGVAADFEALLLPVLDSAYRTAFRLTGNGADAEDLVQDASLLALRGFGGFRPDSNFRAWFFRILMNRFYSGYRRQRRAGISVDLEEAPEQYLYQRADEAGLIAEANPAERVMARIDADTALQALDALPEEFRTVALLYFTQDMAYQEIADVLELPIGTVRSRLHRARRLLKKALWHLAADQRPTTEEEPA